MTGPPEGQHFEIHRNKFKPHPGGDPGQTSAVCITHPMLVFGIGEDPFNGLLAQSIDILAVLTLAQLLRQIQILLPDVGGQNALAFCVGAAGFPAGAVPAVLRADKAVLSFVIGKLPGLVNVFRSFVPGYREPWGYCRYLLYNARGAEAVASAPLSSLPCAREETAENMIAIKNAKCYNIP